eukprot:TRINITY_DN19808_c0_g1_i2.p1 TRINITY_DN19808_c0_g1~~TRINITY_DN19808_c0_g1_i2.p1  ORF type:complete len:774 (+),score=165.06 TRINITY_DN19808_c0_g1_i2:188-2509(+)
MAREEQIPEEERATAADSFRLIKFTLPYADVAQFGPMLTALDGKMAGLQVQNYDVCMTSLEEVFMELGRQAELEAGDLGGANADFWDVEADTASLANYRAEASDVRSMKALASVRVRTITRNRRAFYVTCVLPLLFIVLSMLLAPKNNAPGASAESSSWSLAVYPPMAFGFVCISFTFAIINDKTKKIKHTCMAQGITVSAYWLGTTIGHYLLSLPVMVGLAVCIQWQGPEYLRGNAFWLLVIMLIIYPVNMLLYSYNFAGMFKTAELALKVVPSANMALGTIPTVLVWVLLGPTMAAPWPDVAIGLHVFMSAVNPLYGLPGMLVMMMGKYSPAQQAGPPMTLVDYLLSYAAVPLYLCPLCCLLWGGALVWQDSRSYYAIPGGRQEFDSDRKDRDVLDEEQRVRETAANPPSDEAARYEDLNHTYRSKVNGQWKETHAVRSISLGIRRGECFGLLGPNGAGKTTTLDILTGEVRPPTSGRCTIYGNDLASGEGLQEAYQLLGVCPQVDPIWDDLSGKDHLLFYGAIKGVSQASLSQTADRILQRLGLSVADGAKNAGQYSGGMKRKLSLGIALIGQSPVLFLDEPSAAVDAGAKRHLWKVIKRRSQDQTVVLTTHSMEEAEALCNRIAIQVKGQLRCLGTPSHIKRTYGSGYQLEIFVSSSTAATSSFTAADSFVPQIVPSEDLVRFVNERLSKDAKLIECHAGRYLFQMPPMGMGAGSLTLGKVFAELQAGMQDVGITDYSVTQPSLEQVFIRFAREQEDQEGSTHNGVGDV